MPQPSAHPATPVSPAHPGHPASITFVVPGQRDDSSAARNRGPGAAPLATPLPLPAGLPGTLKASVKLGALRSGGPLQRVSAEVGKDVVLLHLANGPTLVLHPEHARDLLRTQADGHAAMAADGATSTPAPGGTAAAARGGAGAGGATELAEGEVLVPASLQWPGPADDSDSSAGSSGSSTRGATRGLLGDVLLSALQVVTGPWLASVADGLQDGAADALVAHFDAQVHEAVYLLPNTELQALKGAKPVATMVAAPAGAAHLVLVHGTFSDTHGTFGQLWLAHHDLVDKLWSAYGGRVYALDHHTLGASPIDNALTLAKACPPGARLHLLTHSRGGLVAEVLARCAALALDGKGLDEAADRCFHPKLLPGLDKLPEADQPAAKRALAEQKARLAELVDLMHQRKLQVERVVRVACPARGTLLASQRLDAYLSVLKWGLDLAQVPVLPGLLDFLAGVAQRRLDPQRVPGLAAMVPDAPVLRWLHAADEPLPGQLRVLAGDLQGDSLASWLKTLAADAFYWTDNDLVVQTRSMYGGAPRLDQASFLLDQGAQVSHFAYFSNPRSAGAVVDALVEAQPLGWRTIGPLSQAGESADGVRGGDDLPPQASPDRPKVFVLPGILGSHLAVDNKRIWLGWRLLGGLQRLRYPDSADHEVKPDGAVGMVYADLLRYLQATHEVEEFSFDWRKPLEEEAQRLGHALAAALDDRQATGQPVRIVAHSMGGLLARCLQLECPDVWARWMAHAQARLLMLGTPNGGSFAPMQVLSGDDTFGNALVAFGAPFQDHAARQQMARYPGFLQLQAGLLDDSLGLGREATWQQLANDDLARVRAHNAWHADGRQLDAYRWGVPPQAVLDRAKALRQRLDAQAVQWAGQWAGKLVLVVGQARFTPAGWDLGPEGLDYLNAPDAGDGRVTLGSARLPGVPTWQVDAEHGSLPDQKDHFDAYAELLEQGSTSRLPRLPEPAQQRGGPGAATPDAAPERALWVRSRPARQRVAATQPRGLDPRNPLTAQAVPESSASGMQALPVRVHNMDLKFVRQTLMVGHYSATRITGAERVVDGLIGGLMQQSLSLGHYPDAAGSSQLFANLGANLDNPLQMPRPEQVLVVGLGEEGKLRPGALAQAVCDGVFSLAQRLLEKGGDLPAQFELASTLIGSGGSGVSAGQSAQQLAQGVRDANEHIVALNQRLLRSAKRASAVSKPGPAPRLWPRVGMLHLVELYFDRANEAWRALHAQTQAAPGQWRLDACVHTGTGAMRRPLDGGYRGADYDFIRATSREGPHGSTSIEYTLDTKRARSEAHAQHTQARLVRNLVATASNDQNQDTAIGRTLFQLLVPLGVEPFFGGSTEMLLELDGGTAGIPWEMLDTDAGKRSGADPRPWAIRAKLLRKLRLGDFRQQVTDARAESRVLVIGEPHCDPRLYPALPGARAEAHAVVKLLADPTMLGSAAVQGLLRDKDGLYPGPDAREVINALMSQDWRVVHVAGHGLPPEKLGPEPKDADDPPQRDGDPRGVVLDNGTFLGPREIENMRVVPELVFLNCCHLAGRNHAQLLTEAPQPAPYDRAQFASGVAESLIRVGVRCVVAAGWAVEDGAAKLFATTFYTALLHGERFIDAVAQAREQALAKGGNTWAAYQCYGDPDWRLQRDAPPKSRGTQGLGDEYVSVTAPPNLTLALENLAIQCQYHSTHREPQRTRIRYLEARFGEAWGGIGAVAEAFGLAWAEAGDRPKAINWYQRAVQAQDGSASLRASEQLGNLRVKQAWKEVVDADKAWRAAAGPAPGPDAAAANKKARETFDQALADGRENLRAAAELLGRLCGLHETVERLSLQGSASKRLAMLERVAGQDRASRDALQAMQRHYRQAYDQALQAPDSQRFYPALNSLAAQLALAKPGATVALDAALVADVQQDLAERQAHRPDFWSVAGSTELQVYQALARGELVASLAQIEQAWTDLKNRVPDPSNWGSVHDQMCFVLHALLQQAGPREQRDAAQALVQRLAGYAGVAA